MNLQQSIKPIETVYKGYRFRSRLEARWAVFFDNLYPEIEWQYEPQGFDLEGERYLPDFYIPSLKTYVEIKGENLRSIYKIPKLYMAGRMGPNDYRDIDVKIYDYSERPKPEYVIWHDLPIYYCGPFSIDEKAHTSEHGNGNRGSIYIRSTFGIDTCDIFFAYLGDHEAYGTLVEIGYAAGKGKPIVLGVDAACRYQQDAESMIEDLWFSAETAKVVFSGNRMSILSQFSKWMKDNYSPPREIRLARKLASLSGEGVMLAYGDPMEAITKGWQNYGQSGLSKRIKLMRRQELEHAALCARQARFEHGQSGAR